MTDTKFKLFVSCIHQTRDEFGKISEEEKLKTKIAQLLNKEGYRFVIAGVDE